MAKVIAKWLSFTDSTHQKEHTNDSVAPTKNALLQRLDQAVSRRLGLHRSQLKKNQLKVYTQDGLSLKLSKKPPLNVPLLLVYTIESGPCLDPYPLPLRILYENSQALLVNKPSGLVVHPGKGNPNKTLVNALVAHYHGRWFSKESAPLSLACPPFAPQKSDKLEHPHLTEGNRPGIVHRLDKETSGVILVAKDLTTLNFFSQQFAQRRVKKLYIAVVKGRLKHPRGLLRHWIIRQKYRRTLFVALPYEPYKNSPYRTPLLYSKKSKGGGPILSQTPIKAARLGISAYRVLAHKKGYSFLALAPKTGRTHQLRVQLKALGHPIVGDSLYSRVRPQDPTLLLHAFRLSIEFPPTQALNSADRVSLALESVNPNPLRPKTLVRTFKAPIPTRFEDFWHKKLTENPQKHS